MNGSRATFQGEAVHCKKVSNNEYLLLIPQIMVERDLKPSEFKINNQTPKNLIWETTGPTGTRVKAIV
ncbi:hypothetical protein KAU45_00610 [bacterium]|nr:hypothetical protein [bacterium]